MKSTNINNIRYGIQTISKIKYGLKTIWEVVSNILGCFTSGYWINNKRWTNHEGWKNS